jgi:hypothetical protein
MLLEIEPGAPEVESRVRPEPLPTPAAQTVDRAFSIQLTVTNDEFSRYDLLVQTWSADDTAIEIDDAPASPDQRQQASRWTIARYDLRDFRGRAIRIEGARSQAEGEYRPVSMEAWLVADRRVDDHHETPEEGLPFAISQDFRRVTENVLQKTPL